MSETVDLRKNKSRKIRDIGRERVDWTDFLTYAIIRNCGPGVEVGQPKLSPHLYQLNNYLILGSSDM